MFSDTVIQAFKAHALAEYPKEAVGFVVNGQFVPTTNIATDPVTTFETSKDAYPLEGLDAILHSHPNGKLEPSATDIEGQIDSDVPWGLATVRDGQVSDLLFWGPSVPIPPLVGRKFRSGPSGSDGRGDCYAMIRDYYRLELGIELKEYPRDEDWYTASKNQNLYLDNFEDCGWVKISEHELQPGDVFLMTIKSRVPNHAGIYLGKGLGLHHLMDRLSGKDSLAKYKSLITHYLRYEG